MAAENLAIKNCLVNKSIYEFTRRAWKESITLKVTYLKLSKIEGPANVCPLVDTITGSTTKAVFKHLIAA
uniref:Uncharacterized protein n=1 Tax=Solanum tuberosum TaxID=4113 RepID=M1C723_SOLTU